MDHGASTHPPAVVLDTYKDFLEKSYANVHRGRHFLSEMATDRFEDVPDQILRLEAKLREHQVKLVAVTGASNVTGYLPDIHRVARLAHGHGARILVDGAQMLAHAPIDVRPEGHPEHIDFFAGAGHKAYAPFGSSFLFGPRDVFDEAPPYIPAGGTVIYVTEDEAFYKRSPERHEGGTPNIAGAVAFAAALRYLEKIGMDEVRAHERVLVARAMDGLAKLDGVTVLGHPDPAKRIGAVALEIEGVPHEVAATILNREAAIAVRNGCFCAHTYLHRLLHLEDTEELRRRLVAGEDVDLPGAVRPSFGIFNTEEEVDEMVRMIEVIRDRAWKGEYGEIPGAAACKEL